MMTAHSALVTKGRRQMRKCFITSCRLAPLGISGQQDAVTSKQHARPWLSSDALFPIGGGERVGDLRAPSAGALGIVASWLGSGSVRLHESTTGARPLATAVRS